MSGGRFDYDQYKIGYIADEIEKIIERNGRKKTNEELKAEFMPHNWYIDNPEDLYFYEYPENVIMQFKIAVVMLRQAEVYAHRIDWLLSGDDSEESFVKRLVKDLKNL
jgi:hypothetical protein